MEEIKSKFDVCPARCVIGNTLNRDGSEIGYRCAEFKQVCHSRTRRHALSIRSSMCSNFHWTFVIFGLALCFNQLIGIHGFNMDTSRAEIISGDAGSMFGYSVATLAKNNGERWLLVGAPEGSDPALSSVTKPGYVSRCRILSDHGGHECSHLYVDDELGEDSGLVGELTRFFVHGRDNQWLGASIDVKSDVGIVVCAPRWFNKYFEADDAYYMNGICYEIPVDFNRNNIRKLPALVNGNRQTMPSIKWNTTFDYGMGALGMSTHYTESGSDLLLGAPGLRTWTGGFVDLRQDDVYYLEGNSQPTEDSEMYGYAITSGKFFPGMVTYYAIGGPRFNLRGRVLLFRGDGIDFLLENGSPALDGMEFENIEIPVNGYFGAALCAVDVNNDGLDDLLVGAPFYSVMTNAGDKTMEEGIVFVYLGSQETGRFGTSSPPLRGDNALQARFGTAISSLGDINSDNYNDVVIGAPYEDDMRGALYIYNGCNEGVWPRYSQRIAAADVDTGLKAFGISLSKAEDMNQDGINDVAAGAYLSDQAVLLYGAPVISLTAYVTSENPDIDRDTTEKCVVPATGESLPCFTVKFCFTFSDRKYNSVDLDLELSVDTILADYPRVAFAENSESTLTMRNVRVFLSALMCEDKGIIIKSTADLVTPVIISMDYVLTGVRGSAGIKPTANQFNGDAPNAPLTRVQTELEFKKNCPNNDCKTDVKIEADLVYDKTLGFFIVGTAPTVAIDVTISKTGDPSYGSNLYFTLPRSLQYRKVERVWGDTEIKCDFEEQAEKDAGRSSTTSTEDEKDFLLVCGYGNPMTNDTGVRFSLVIAIPDQVTESEFDFFLNATTMSTELQPRDNVKSLRLTLRNKVATEFMGVSRPSLILAREAEDEYTASHIFEIRNLGPSPLPETRLTVRFPQVQTSGSDPHLYLNRTTYSCGSPCEVTCFLPDEGALASPHVYVNEKGPSYDVSEAGLFSASKSSVRNIDCIKESCPTYECFLRNIPPRESAVVSLDFVINKKLLGDSDSAVKFSTDALVNLRQPERLITTTYEHITFVLTEVVPQTPPPQPLPWWIILVSVLGGILLIVLIVVILWKIGFFRRKQKEEMEKKKQEEGEGMLKEEPCQPAEDGGDMEKQAL